MPIEPRKVWIVSLSHHDQTFQNPTHMNYTRDGADESTCPKKHQTSQRINFKMDEIKFDSHTEGLREYSKIKI